MDSKVAVQSSIPISDYRGGARLNLYLSMNYTPVSEKFKTGSTNV